MWETVTFTIRALISRNRCEITNHVADTSRYIILLIYFYSVSHSYFRSIDNT